MKTIKTSIAALFLVLGCSLFYFFNSDSKVDNSKVQLVDTESGEIVAPIVRKSDGFDPMKDQSVKPMPKYLNKSMRWLARAQARNGGYGSGQHSAQHIRDPRQVNVDPATTSLVGLAIMRVGNTLEKGDLKSNLRKALGYMLKTAEGSEDDAPNITKQVGTQPQRKLGQNIDVALAAQFFIRISPMAENEDELQIRIDEAITKCLRKIESSQLADGSWNDRGWARVLSSAMANNALEMADAEGIKIDKQVLAMSRNYQEKNVDARSGKASTAKSAGVDLYTYSSTQRATAKSTKKINEIMRSENIKESRSSDFKKTKQVLAARGYTDQQANDMVASYQVNRVAKESLKDEKVLAGFGNNGGEEYLSYMMSSEAFVMSQDNKSWNHWHKKMDKNLGAVMNKDGSWSGHHCITSPVFCTAAVIMTLTADRDGDNLKRVTANF